jgi:hypothetical protein
MQGNGDIDMAQYGFRIETVEFATISGHRASLIRPRPAAAMHN